MQQENERKSQFGFFHSGQGQQEAVSIQAKVDKLVEKIEEIYQKIEEVWQAICEVDDDERFQELEEELDQGETVF